MSVTQLPRHPGSTHVISIDRVGSTVAVKLPSLPVAPSPLRDAKEEEGERNFATYW
jgi:hypothetical protein